MMLRRRSSELTQQGKCCRVWCCLFAHRSRAVLTYASARQLLDLFCAKIPDKDRSEQTEPIFLLDGEPGAELRARVHLPSSLPSDLRIAASLHSWRTEKRAKQDAAFQACRALHEAGLVSDHLLPPEWPEESKAPKEDDKIEQSDSFYNVADQYDPWPAITELWNTPGGARVFAHPLQFEASDGAYPKMLLLLPVKLSAMTFPLFPLGSARVQVTVEAGVETRDFPEEVARDITFLLLTTLLGRRLQNLQKDDIPLLFVPDIEPGSLQAWFEAASTNISMTTSNRLDLSSGKTYLIRYARGGVPHLWQPARSRSDDSEGFGTEEESRPSTITAKRLPKKLNHLVLPLDYWSDRSEALPAAECSVLGVPSEYARLVLLVPSIMFRLEISLRTAAACQGPLSSLRLHNHDAISRALTLPMEGVEDYERLEFYGDTLLKFYAALQLFVDYPNHPSYQLTRDRSCITNNTRLQQANRALNLSQYLSRRAFASNEWAAGVGDVGLKTKKIPPSELPSKVLADIIEAIIGAASLGDVNGGYSEEKVLATLSLFFDEIPWRSVSKNVERIYHPDQTSQLAAETLAPVEHMIGYVFEDRGLLAEALTSSSLAVSGRSTYDRLEFLGDAVLDYIIVPKLFHSPLNLKPAEMTLRRAALASHFLLAFFALGTSGTRETFQVQTDVRTKKTTHEQSYETVHLPDHIRRISDRQASEDRKALLKKFQKVQPKILKRLEPGASFPWTLLSEIGAPKSHSDIIESILAAVFIDSRGNLQACESVLEKIGYMSLVRRFVSERDVDVLHPESRLFETVQSLGLSSKRPALEIIAQCRAKEITSGKSWRCKVMLQGQMIASIAHTETEKEARYRACEKAVEVLKKKRKQDFTKTDDHEVAKRHKQTQEEENVGEEAALSLPLGANEEGKDSTPGTASPTSATKPLNSKTRVAWLSDVSPGNAPTTSATKSPTSKTRVAWLSDAGIDHAEQRGDQSGRGVVEEVGKSPHSTTRAAWL